MRIGILELVVVIFVAVWVARRVRTGRICAFDCAWIGLGVGVALMFSRPWFTLGAVVAGTSFAAITLPLARVEWQRRVGSEPR